MSKTGILGKLAIAALLLSAGAWVGWRIFPHRGGGVLDAVLPRTVIDQKVTLSVLRSEAMTFLVTRRTTTQIVVEHRQSDWAGEWQGVLWATVNWTWGADLSKLTEKDLRREGDVVYCRLPEPQLLDFAIVPGSECFFSKATVIPKLQELFRTGSQQKLLHDQIRAQALHFAADQKLCPTRRDMIRQLNEAAASFKQAAGVDLRFE